MKGLTHNKKVYLRNESLKSKFYILCRVGFKIWNRKTNRALLQDPI